MYCFNDLPVEIIANIYRYIDVEDILSAEQTCHQWLKASQLKEFVDLINLKLTRLDDTIQNLFKNTIKRFSSLHFSLNEYTCYYSQKDEEFARIANDNLLEFFSSSNIINNIEYLTLENFKSFPYSTLCEILAKLPNLKQFRCVNVMFKYSLNEYFKDEYIGKFSEKLSNITSPKLKSLYLENAEPLELFCNIKNLTELYLDSNEASHDDESFVEIVKSNESCLSRLKFDCWTIVHIDWDDLANLSKLKLKEFSIYINYGIMSFYESFVKFLKNQSNIIDLSVTNLKALKDEDIIEILGNLSNLQKLNLSDNRNLTNSIIQPILNLNNIKTLAINNLKNVKPNGIFSELFKKHHNINELSVLNVELTDEEYNSISENLINLELLNCGAGNLTNNTLYNILKNCKKISGLVIHNSNVMDNAFIGTELKSGKLLHLSLQCDKICDETLIHGFKYENLTALNLLITSNMSAEGFKHVTDHCPNIKDLILRKICSSKISLNFLQIICVAMINLPKLKKINVRRRCVCLDTSSFDYQIYLKKKSKIEDGGRKCTCDFWTHFTELWNCWNNPSLPFSIL